MVFGGGHQLGNQDDALCALGEMMFLYDAVHNKTNRI